MNKSIGPNLKYIQKIEEQAKIIEHLKMQYKQKTGFEAPQIESADSIIQQQNASMVNMSKSIIHPQTKQISLSKLQEEEKTAEQFQTFYDAVAHLRLPTKIIPNKTRPIRSNFKTNIDLKNPFHLIESIDLSGYASRNFNRMGLKDFLESIQDVKTLKSLNLKNNGIDDSYVDELKFIITNTSVSILDLSSNEIGPKGIEPMLQSLKEVSYFKSVDLSRNKFSSSPIILNLLSQAIQQQRDMYHVSLDAMKVGQSENKSSDILIRLVTSHKPIKSVIFQDTQLHEIKLLCSSLSNPTSHLTELTLKFCYLTVDQIQQLAASLCHNTSIVYLNLQHNAIKNNAGHYIAEMIYSNHYIYSLDLEHNQLGDQFISELGQSLKRNNVIQQLKLGYNIIQNISALFQVLGPDNHTLTDLGNIQQNPINSNQIEQLSKRVKSDDNQGAYKVLSNINFAITLHKAQDSFRVWNL